MRLVFASHGNSRSTCIVLCDWLFAVLNCLDRSRSEEFHAKACRLIKEEKARREGEGEKGVDLVEIFLLLLDGVDGIFSILEIAKENKEITLGENVRRKYSELYRESEEFFISLLSMLVSPEFDVSRLKECKELFLSGLIGASNMPCLRISILRICYDTFGQDYDLLIRILNYICDHGHMSPAELSPTLFDGIEKVIGNFDDLSPSLEHRRGVYKSLFNIVDKYGDGGYLNKKSYDYLRLYLETFNEASEIEKSNRDNNHLVEYGIRFVVSSIIIPDILFFDSIVPLPITNYVRDTQTSKSVEVNTLFRLLDICSSGKISDYYDDMQNTEEYKRLVSRYRDIGDCESNIIRKLQLLTIPTLAKDKKSISLGQLKSEFRLSSFDTQDVVVHAISIGLIDGFISEDSDTLHINCITKRQFGDDEWDALNDKITDWITHLNSLSSLLLNGGAASGGVAIAGAGNANSTIGSSILSGGSSSAG